MPHQDQPPSLQQLVHRALRAWREIDGDPENLLDNLLLVRTRRKAQAQSETPATSRLVTNAVLLEGIEELSKRDELGACILRERFLNGETTLKVAYMLNLSEHQINRTQAKAIETLSKILESQNASFCLEQVRQIETHLPPPTYTRLFGVSQAQATLLQKLCSKAPSVVAISGLGGLGKTALADAVVRQLIPRFQFDRVIWLRADPQSLSGESLSPIQTFDDLIVQLGAQLIPESGRTLPWEHLRQQLKETPSIVVIDNLETEADALYLFHQLGDLTGPSKFLLTSRTQPPAQAGVYTMFLNELSPSEAAALIRHHAQIIGLIDLADAPETTLSLIIQRVGGNPLALKLVVSLALVLPLPRILDDLPVGRTEKIEQMYQHIYRKTWEALSPSARALLQVMPVIAESGAQLEQLQAISKLSDSELLLAIQELVSRSLLEMRGTAWERRYGIHRLTESFLRAEIIDWPEST